MTLSTKRALLKGFLDMLPLCLAVIPWGILCGSLAIQNGFSAFETQAMSLLVFAGSAPTSRYRANGWQYAFINYFIHHLHN